MFQSMRTTRTSLPSCVMRCLARSTVKVSVVMMGLAVCSEALRCAEAGEEFVRTKGLGQVVVGTGIEGLHFVIGGVAGGEDKGGDAVPGEQLFDDRYAVDARQPKVQDDDRQRVLGGGEERGLAVRGGGHRVARPGPETLSALERICRRAAPEADKGLAAITEQLVERPLRLVRQVIWATGTWHCVHGARAQYKKIGSQSRLCAFTSARNSTKSKSKCTDTT